MADLALTLDGTNPIFTPNRIKARNQHELVDQINKINNIMINVDANTFTLKSEIESHATVLKTKILVLNRVQPKIESYGFYWDQSWALL